MIWFCSHKIADWRPKFNNKEKKDSIKLYEKKEHGYKHTQKKQSHQRSQKKPNSITRNDPIFILLRVLSRKKKKPNKQVQPHPHPTYPPNQRNKPAKNTGWFNKPLLTFGGRFFRIGIWFEDNLKHEFCLEYIYGENFTTNSACIAKIS